MQLSNIIVCNQYLKINSILGLNSHIFTSPYKTERLGSVIFFLSFFFSFKLNSFLFLSLCVHRSIPPALLMSVNLLTQWDHFWERVSPALGILVHSRANLTRFLEFYGVTAAFFHAAFVSPQAHVSLSRLSLLESWLPSSDPWTSLFPIVPLQYACLTAPIS